MLCSDGEYSPRKEVLNMKYTDEVRLCVGVAMVKTPDGHVKGRRAATFDYSGKVVLSKKDYEARMEQEIRRVKNLPAGNEWKTRNRKPEELFADNDVKWLKGVGPTKLAALKAADIKTISDILNHNGPVKGIGNKLLQSLKSQASCAQCKNTPADFFLDCKDAPNPYLARYGQNWKNVIKKTGLL